MIKCMKEERIQCWDWWGQWPALGHNLSQPPKTIEYNREKWVFFVTKCFISVHQVEVTLSKSAELNTYKPYILHVHLSTSIAC